MSQAEQDPPRTNTAFAPGGAGPKTLLGPAPEMTGADALRGNDVVNRQDEVLGSIKEIMLDVDSGRVGYAVVSYGGFLGMGEKLFAVPWQALTRDSKHKRLILDLDKDRLKGAPGFDNSRWPDMADRTWVNAIHTYYGIQPYSD
ncbi:MAG: PRC-barrel domain-containing protein [Gammaproteobacteria bacterium]|jgi:sporulation protein YlmC with PRC-barrel domain|nr:PRC-barrel domain-containing protein [Gammaproteobacteria bacterium]